MQLDVYFRREDIEGFLQRYEGLSEEVMELWESSDDS
jgi:hypothetical protein